MTHFCSSTVEYDCLKLLIYLLFVNNSLHAFLLGCVHWFASTPMNLEPTFVSLCAEQISTLLKDSVHPEGSEGTPLAYTGSM